MIWNDVLHGMLVGQLSLYTPQLVPLLCVTAAYTQRCKTHALEQSMACQKRHNNVLVMVL